MTESKQEIKINQISDVVWEIPKTGKMNVPTRVFASEKLLKKMKQDRTLVQGSNVAALPGIYKYACVMPDGHEGFQVSELLTRPNTVSLSEELQHWILRKAEFHPVA